MIHNIRQKLFLALSVSAFAVSAIAAPSLRSKNPEEGLEAAKGLAKAKASKAVPTLVSGLALGLHKDVTVAALDALAVHGAENTKKFPKKAVKTLLEYARHRNDLVRVAAYKGLVPVKGKDVDKLFFNALKDKNQNVRQVAARQMAARKFTQATPALLQLLKKGDVEAGKALSTLADVKTAKEIIDLNGHAPDDLLASTLGDIAMRKKLGSEEDTNAILSGLAKVPGPETIKQLQRVVDSIPEKPFSQKRKEAEILLKQRLGQ